MCVSLFLCFVKDKIELWILVIVVVFCVCCDAGGCCVGLVVAEMVKILMSWLGGVVGYVGFTSIRWF